MKYALTMFAVLSYLCGSSMGQVLADQPLGWDQRVAALAAALVQEDPAPAAVMLHDVELRRFDPHAPARLSALLDRTSGSAVIFMRVYTGVPTHLAADMAEDINAADLPDPLRRQFTPNGAAAMRDANTVAADWIRDTLNPADDQPIAVLVIWRGQNTLPSLSPAHYAQQITFVLLQGDKEAASSTTIRRVFFGNPLGDETH